MRTRARTNLRTSCIAALGSAALLVGATAAGATKTFTDPAGDAPAGALDVTEVSVRNDAAKTLLFEVVVANGATFQVGGAVAVLLNADADLATGARPLGFDYLLAIGRDESGFGKSLSRWNGTEFADIDDTPLAASWGTDGPIGTARFGISSTAIGARDTFDFVVLGAAPSADGNVPPLDLAPDLGVWTYAVEVPRPLSLQVVGFTSSSRKPRAGREFVVFVVIKRSDTGGTLKSGTVRCAARIGGKPVRNFVHGYVLDTAECSWLIPRGTAGKRLIGSITVTFQGAQVVRRFSLPIK
jgi:hypothetical protein